jgi:uncharacterized membrane protein
MSERPRYGVEPLGRASLWRDHLANQLWVIPATFGLGALLVAVTLARSDPLHDALGDLGYLGDRDSARLTLGTISAAMLTFLGIVFSITVLALQLASNQFSPRVLRVFQRDRKTQVVLGIFLGTFVFSLASMAELGEQGADAAPLLVGIAFVLVAASLVAFLVYLQHITWSLRAVAIIEAIAAEARSAIPTVYPEATATAPSPALAARAGPRIEVPGHDSGVIAAVDLRGLVEQARVHDAYVRILHPVGSYVAFGEPLLEIDASAENDARRFTRSIDIAPARTMLQDVAFGVRELVDIAERALSPAVNDPTTAVQVLDRIGDLLGRLALRSDPPTVFADREGTARVEWVVPSWGTLVDLAFNEIRWFGQQSEQVTRRMYATLDYLIELAPPHRHSPLLAAREQLDEAVTLGFPESIRVHAGRPDPLGLGGRND